MPNRLQAQYAESLLDKILSERHPSTTHMDMFETVATPRQLVLYTAHLVKRIENERNPSIPMMQRVQRLTAQFGS